MTLLSAFAPATLSSACYAASENLRPSAVLGVLSPRRGSKELYLVFMYDALVPVVSATERFGDVLRRSN